LASGRTLYGTFATFPDTRFVEFLGLAGFDWIMLDGEHDGLGVETCYQLATAARSVGMAVVVRAPSGRADVLGRLADVGVDAIICPHVVSAERARHLVGSLRFPPGGWRGAAASVRAAGYGLLSSAPEYFADRSRHPMPAALLEDAEAYQALDEILAVDGLEMVCIGTGDLAASLGTPGEPGNPAVTALVDEALPRIRAAGLTISAAAGTPEAAAAWHDRGARMILVPAVGMLGSAIRSYLAAAPR
jgi:2-keto-3-deoxy-L-rhamnonate aldolase RhmA